MVDILNKSLAVHCQTEPACVWNKYKAFIARESPCLIKDTNTIKGRRDYCNGVHVNTRKPKNSGIGSPKIDKTLLIAFYKFKDINTISANWYELAIKY